MASNTDEDTELTPSEVSDALQVGLARVYRLDHVLQPRFTVTSGGYKRRRYSSKRVDRFIAARARLSSDRTNYDLDFASEDE